MLQFASTCWGSASGAESTVWEAPGEGLGAALLSACLARVLCPTGNLIWFPFKPLSPPGLLRFRSQHTPATGLILKGSSQGGKLSWRNECLPLFFHANHAVPPCPHLAVWLCSHPHVWRLQVLCLSSWGQFSSHGNHRTESQGLGPFPSLFV